MSVEQQKGSAANSRDTAVTRDLGYNDGLARMAALIVALRKKKTPPDEDLKQEVKNVAFPSTNAAAKNLQVPKLTKREEALNAPQVKPSE